jgi:hypothetical protein
MATKAGNILYQSFEDKKRTLANVGTGVCPQNSNEESYMKCCVCESKSPPIKLSVNIIQSILDKEQDIIDDYLFTPQICGGWTPLPPSIRSSSTAAVATITDVAAFF